MATRPPPAPLPRPARRSSAGPGRPKDPAKRRAILDAAKRMFLADGLEGVSMEQIAAAAGVSKLTVYSHFGNKDTLFVAAVQAHCEQQLPSALFDRSPGTPLPRRLLEIARAFHALSSSPEAIATHRMLCAPQLAGTALPQMFWEAGPQRVQDEFSELLRRRVAAGELAIGPDADAIPRAAAQFFTLLKGEPHAMLVLGCAPPAPAAIEAHLAAAVDLFLRAYATDSTRAADPCPTSR